eukprot:470943-Pelagomonas_calceolata.AAC.7
MRPNSGLCEKLVCFPAAHPPHPTPPSPHLLQGEQKTSYPPHFSGCAMVQWLLRYAKAVFVKGSAWPLLA